MDLINNFEKLTLLGEGGEGACYLGNDKKNGGKVVRKRYKTNLIPTGCVPAEITLLKQHLPRAHPNIVRILDWDFEKVDKLANTRLNVFYDYCPHGSLVDHSAKEGQAISEEFAWQ